MNLKQTFKNLVLLTFFIMVLSFIAMFFESAEVIYLNEQLNSKTSDTQVYIVGIIALILLITFLINLFFLYEFKKIGKPMFLFLFIIQFFISPFMGTYAYEPFTYIIEGLGWAASGAILVFLYFTPIKKEFEK
ncbi:uncharacterized protein METZ01_LOCUS298467 [marine metagenome]|uniref:Major facilitator superfamily (MFS) profile domain-containing protein n=1 Tax=marine metagenome TaxID=408172 RepID=A0A382M9F0_9ZZZZ